MAKEKVCPLKFTASSTVKVNEVGWYCDKEQCAWWNAGEKNCAIHVLAHYVSAIWEHRYQTERGK